MVSYIYKNSVSNDLAIIVKLSKDFTLKSISYLVYDLFEVLLEEELSLIIYIILLWISQQWII